MYRRRPASGHQPGRPPEGPWSSVVARHQCAGSSVQSRPYVGVLLQSAFALAQTPPNPQPPSPSPDPSTQPPPPVAFTVDVIETTPLPGVDLPLEKIPAPVQTAISADIEPSGALDLSDFLNRRFNGVYVNEMQGNPFQPDLNYRGYTASPLLGTPQGLSVYMDGVRLNQPFGDVVSWDLIPRIAIGSDDADARLESAVRAEHARRRAVDPDQGRPKQPGHDRAAIYGSNVRRAVEFEHGGSRRERTALVRGRQPVRRRRLARRFAVGRRPDVRQARAGTTPRRDTSLSVGYANNSLTGNGLQEQRFLDRDYASVYTKPDKTDNRVDVPQPHDAPRRRSQTLGFAATCTTAHPDQHVQRRHQRGLARPVGLSAERRGTARRSPPPATPGFRPAAPTRPTRRFRSGAASATCCSTTSPARSATGC